MSCESEKQAGSTICGNKSKTMAQEEEEPNKRKGKSGSNNINEKITRKEEAKERIESMSFI